MSYFAYEPEHITDDPGFLRLPAEAGYLYMMLANRMLRHGPLSPDKEFYRLMWGSRCRRFSLAWDQAASVIDRDSDGFLVISWALDARLEASDALKSDRARKQKARSEARERTVSAGLPPDVQGKSTGCPPLTVGRSVGETNNAVSEDKPRRAKKSPTGPQAECFEHWKTEWARTRNGAAFVGATKDFVAITALLALADAEEVKRRMTLMVTDPDIWIAKNASPALLRSKWNTYDGIPSRPRFSYRSGSADDLPDV